MANISHVSSEEELLQLRNEGKITEDEYEDLLQTLQKTARPDAGPVLQDEVLPVRTSGLAIASLVFSIVGPITCVPAIICGHLALRKMGREPAVRGYGLAIAGLIIGYIILGISVAVTVPFLLFLGAKVRSAQHISVVVEFKSFPLDDMEGLVTQTDVQIDKQISRDGNGSLRIEAAKPVTIRLFETGDIDIEDARLVYQAKVKTENVEGQVYLEMLCQFPGKGDFFSRGLMTPLSGSTDWTTQETPFFLKGGENPDNIKLNVVIDGKGTVWIDDIRLLKGALN
jgi:hypothetical protein